MDSRKLDELLNVSQRMEDRLMRIEGSLAQLLETNTQNVVVEPKGKYLQYKFNIDISPTRNHGEYE